MEDIDLQDTLAHDIKEKLRVVGTLLGGDHVVHHGRAEKLDVLLCKLEERERRDSAGSISEGNEGPFPLQELEIIVEPARGDQCTVCSMCSEKKRTCPFQHRQTPLPRQHRS